MKLKLDENLSRHLGPVIAALGHDVKTAKDEGLLSQTDQVIFAAAVAEGRMLLTLDLGFADIRRYPPGTHHGIILFRPAGKGILTVQAFVERFLRGRDLTVLAGCVVVVDTDRVRVRTPGG